MRLISLAAVVLLATACASTPTNSRTGVVKEITIVEAPNPANLFVNPGDEVKWVNKRGDYVRVDLLETRTADLTCNKGFYEYLGSFGATREFVDLEPNATASACFPEATGTVDYTVRMESAMPGGKKVVPGKLTVGSR
jgi:plastocyanin